MSRNYNTCLMPVEWAMIGPILLGKRGLCVGLDRVSALARPLLSCLEDTIACGSNVLTVSPVSDHRRPLDVMTRADSDTTGRRVHDREILTLKLRRPNSPARTSRKIRHMTIHTKVFRSSLKFQRGTQMLLYHFFAVLTSSCAYLRGKLVRTHVHAHVETLFADRHSSKTSLHSKQTSKTMRLSCNLLLRKPAAEP